MTVVPFGTKFDADQEQYNLHIMRVLRVRNRFDPDIPEAKLLGGYRDIGLKLELGYSMTASGDVKFLPCKRWKANDTKFKVVLLLFAPVMRSNAFDTQAKVMVVELQLRLGQMIPRNFKELHARYVTSRNMLSL